MDVALQWLRIRPRGSTGRDLADLLAGRPLLVSAFHRPDRDSRWHPGRLHLDLSALHPVVWTPWRRPPPGRRAEDYRLCPSYELSAVQETTSHQLPLFFCVLDLTAGGRSFPLAVPAIDLPLVRRALNEAAASTTP